MGLGDVQAKNVPRGKGIEMNPRAPLKAKRLGTRGWFWRQMATQAERREFGLKTVFLYPLLKVLYRRKKTWSHVAPVLVVGQNPWLNALAVWRLSLTHDEVWVWDIKRLDWWNYNILHTQSFLNACKKWFPYMQFDSVRKILEWLRAQSAEQAKVYVIKDQYHPWKIFKDNHSGGWVFKLTEGEWPVMEGVLKAGNGRNESKIRLEGTWREATQAVWPKTLESNPDDDRPCHYLLAKRVVWSSLPPSGVEIHSELTEGYRSFEFAGGETMGCAKRIAQTPETFFQHPFDDTEKVLKMGLTGP